MHDMLHKLSLLLGLVRPTLYVLAMWVSLCLMFVGVGSLVRRLFRLRLDSGHSVFMSFWMGWVGWLVILQLWHLVLPVDWRAFVLLAAVGGAGLAWSGRDVWSLWRRLFPLRIAFCAVVGAAALLLAVLAIAPPTHYDTGLYHLSAVRWGRTYPIVPGLGNLHGRLGFNCSYLLYVAMLEVGFWLSRSCHIANGVLVLVFLAQAMGSVFKLLEDRHAPSTYHLFNVLVLPPALGLGMGFHLSSLSPDLVVSVLGFVLSGQLLLLLTEGGHDARKQRYALFYLATLAAVGITVKLSFLVLGMVSLIVGLVAWRSRTQEGGKAAGRGTLALVGLAVAVPLVTWMVRGVILTGYVAYPSTVGSFDVEWRIPRGAVVAEADAIKGWARAPGPHYLEALGNWRWLRAWCMTLIHHWRFDVVYPIFLAVGGLFLQATLLPKGSREGGGRLQWLFIAPSGLSLVFWFLTAPDPRFAVGAFWLLAAGVLSFVTRALSRSWPVLALWIALGLSAVLSVDQLRHVKPVGPGEDYGFHPTPRAELATFVTDSGLVVYVPQSRDKDQCWDGPLPCTPYREPSLRLRRPGQLRHGFAREAAATSGSKR